MGISLSLSDIFPKHDCVQKVAGKWRDYRKVLEPFTQKDWEENVEWREERRVESTHFRQPSYDDVTKLFEWFGAALE